jgi:hypothetical protein
LALIGYLVYIRLRMKTVQTIGGTTASSGASRPIAENVSRPVSAQQDFYQPSSPSHTTSLLSAVEDHLNAKLALKNISPGYCSPASIEEHEGDRVEYNESLRGSIFSSSRGASAFSMLSAVPRDEGCAQVLEINHGPDDAYNFADDSEAGALMEMMRGAAEKAGSDDEDAMPHHGGGFSPTSHQRPRTSACRRSLNTPIMGKLKPMVVESAPSDIQAPPTPAPSWAANTGNLPSKPNKKP